MYHNWWRLWCQHCWLNRSMYFKRIVFCKSQTFCSRRFVSFFYIPDLLNKKNRQYKILQYRSFSSYMREGVFFWRPIYGMGNAFIYLFYFIGKVYYTNFFVRMMLVKNKLPLPIKLYCFWRGMAFSLIKWPEKNLHVKTTQENFFTKAQCLRDKYFLSVIFIFRHR